MPGVETSGMFGPVPDITGPGMFGPVPDFPIDFGPVPDLYGSGTAVAGGAEAAAGTCPCRKPALGRPRTP